MIVFVGLFARVSIVVDSSPLPFLSPHQETEHCTERSVMFVAAPRGPKLSAIAHIPGAERNAGPAAEGRARNRRSASRCKPTHNGQAQKPNPSVIQWLLDSDPAIRWQVLRDLLAAPPEQVAAERARVATEGMGAQLLALQGADGAWSGTAWNHGWDSTMHTLALLRELGLDPASDEARRALILVRERVTWRGWDWDGTWRGEAFAGTPFFVGEVEPCINGQTAASGAYFGQDVERLIERLLGEQLADGGWNCEAERGSTRGSFHTTICVLEALLEYELAGGNRVKATAARLRGQEYLLERRLLRRRSTGELIDPAWTRFAFPCWWHYDVLRGLDYLRKAGARPDARVAAAIELVESRRDSDGRWPLDHQHPGVMPVELDAGVGQASRWNTLRALRVLDWYAA